MMSKVTIVGAVIATLCVGAVNANQLQSSKRVKETDKAGSKNDAEKRNLWKHEPTGPDGTVMKLNGVDISSDGRMVIAACTRLSAQSWAAVARAIDMKTGKGLRDFYGHSQSLSSVAISPDGTFALTGSWDRTMRQWDTKTGKELRKFEGHRFPVLGLAISPDGKQALSCSDGFRLWDLSTGKLLHTFTEHKKTVWAVRFSPDGKRALSGSWDETMRLWDLETREEMMRFEGHNGRVKTVRFSPDGQLGLSCATSDPTVRLWKLETGELVREFKGHQQSVAAVDFSPNGRHILSTGGGHTGGGRWIERPAKIRLWDVATGKQIGQLEGHSSYCASAVFAPNGRQIISAGGDGVIRCWDVKDLVMTP